MGRKATVRSAGKALGAADKESARRQRELDREKKQHDKMIVRQQAAQDVAQYENRLERISSLHLQCSDRIDWAGLASQPSPVEPRRSKAEQQAASKALTDYEPGKIARMTGRDSRRRLELEAAIEAAVHKDTEDFKIAHGRWLAKMEDWRRTSGLARKVLAGNPEAKVEAVRRFGRFAKIPEIGSNVVVRIGNAGSVAATLTAHGKDIVPGEILRQLKSGKLSVKKMPKGRFNELHRGHVCSCLIRAANELFSLLPDNEVVVTITDKLPDSTTGDLEDTPVVSARVVRETFESFDLNDIDPADVVASFVHNMSFKKYKGLTAVAPVDPSQCSH